jgi:CheY-like chemotaxis protein
VVRAGQRKLLELIPDLVVVGEVDDVLALIPVVSQLRPDLVLIDICMPVPNGREATARSIKNSLQVRVTILSMHLSAGYVLRTASAAPRRCRLPSPRRSTAGAGCGAAGTNESQKSAKADCIADGQYEESGAQPAGDRALVMANARRPVPAVLQSGPAWFVFWGSGSAASMHGSCMLAKTIAIM